MLGWDLLKALLSTTTLYFFHASKCFRANVTKKSMLTVWKTNSVQFRSRIHNCVRRHCRGAGGSTRRGKEEAKKKGKKVKKEQGEGQEERMEINITAKNMKPKDNNKNENEKEEDNIPAFFSVTRHLISHKEARTIRRILSLLQCSAWQIHLSIRVLQRGPQIQFTSPLFCRLFYKTVSSFFYLRCWSR